MMWHKVFWLWFAVSVLLTLAIMLEDVSLGLLFGALLAGLGLSKLASEQSSQPRLKRKLLDRLKPEDRA